MTQGKELVGSTWQHREQGVMVTVREQFRVGEDIDSWVDCRDTSNVCIMMRAEQLVRDYQRLDLQH